MALGAKVMVNDADDATVGTPLLIEVEQRLGEPAAYRLRYPVDIDEGDLPLLVEGRLGAGAKLSVLAGTEGGTQCLVKGPVSGQQILFRHGGGDSVVDVLGGDASIAMDRETKAAVWTDATDSDVVDSIVSDYGWTPDIESTDAQATTSTHDLVQRASDLQFVRRLARRNGYCFWLTAASDGTITAHFRRPRLDASPVATLRLNREPPTCTQLSLTWDVERPTSAESEQVDLLDKSTIDGASSRSPLSALAATALADIVTDTRSIRVVVPADDAGALRARSEAALIEAGWFVRASCETTANLAGAAIQAGDLVTLEGLGSRHSGKYLVMAARHTIDAADHVIALELARNAWEK
jgi:phage protein D